MYHLESEYFLYESDNITSLKIEYSDSKSISIDPNTRSLLIRLESDARLGDLASVPGMKILGAHQTPIDELDVTLRSDVFILNGVRYYFADGITTFNQCLTSDTNSTILVEDNNCSIIINPEQSKISDSEDYVLFVNGSDKIYAKIERASDWKLLNYTYVDIFHKNLPKSENSEVISTSSIDITGSDIVNAFIEFLSTNFAPYDIKVYPELNDLTDLGNKTSGFIFYKSGQSTHDGQLISHMFHDPEMGKFIYTKIQMELEYVTDDLPHYELFKDWHQLEKVIFHKSKFILKDKHEGEWNCNVVWDYQLEGELDRSPSTKNLESSILYSHKFNCEIYGFIVEKYIEYPRIVEVITNVINKSTNKTYLTIVKP